MYRNLPLTLDNRTELYINEYIQRNQLTGDIIFVKGDLHQSAITHGKFFTYKSVSSLFGSSNWIHANFGYTDWGCDYEILTTQGSMSGIIKDKKQDR